MIVLPTIPAIDLTWPRPSGGGGSPAPAAVASLSLAPSSGSIAVGATLQLTATARDANSNVLTGRTITFASSAPGTASVSTTGLVTGVAAGSVTITATCEGVSVTMTTTVTAAATPPSGAALVFAAPSALLTLGGADVTIPGVTVYNADGTVNTGAQVTYTLVGQ